MPTVETTKEYEKCRDALLIRGGKIGKAAYDMARIAEAEAAQGKIQTIRSTHHGENRIPEGEKYDLAGDYRLVVQRLRGQETTRVFRFVGSHDDTERWLDTHRGSRWQPERKTLRPPDLRGQLEKEQRRREQERQELAGQVQGLEQEKEKLNQDLRASEEELARRALEVEASGERQRQLEADCQQLRRQREELLAAQAKLASAKTESLDAARRKADEDIAQKLAELEASQARVNTNRRQLANYREELIVFKRQVDEERLRSHKELEIRNAQTQQLASRIAELEEQNRRLQIQVANDPAQSELWGRNRRIWLWAFLMATGVILVLVVILSIVMNARSTPSQGVRATAPQAPEPPSQHDPAPAKPVAPVIAKRESDLPADAPNPHPLVEAPQIGPLATDKQMIYVDDLCRDKKWSWDQRDAEISKVLGYVRKYGNLSKREASQVIDAWKARK